MRIFQYRSPRAVLLMADSVSALGLHPVLQRGPRDQSRCRRISLRIREVESAERAPGYPAEHIISSLDDVDGQCSAMRPVASDSHPDHGRQQVKGFHEVSSRLGFPGRHEQKQERAELARQVGTFDRQSTRNVLPEFDGLLAKRPPKSCEHEFAARLAYEPQGNADLAQGENIPLVDLAKFLDRKSVV